MIEIRTADPPHDTAGCSNSTWPNSTPQHHGNGTPGSLSSTSHRGVHAAGPAPAETAGVEEAAGVETMHLLQQCKNWQKITLQEASPSAPIFYNSNKT